MRTRKPGRAAAAVAVVAAMLVGAVVGAAGTAGAASLETIRLWYCDKTTVSVEKLTGMNGLYLCGGGFGREMPIYTFDDGTVQTFFIGADHAVWTYWTNPDETRSPLVSLGGRATSDVRVNAYNGAFVQLEVIGTDSRHWFNNRAVNGSWSGWFR
ncbi:hypothetical protein ACFCX4_33775 [Kitasatospora sp. NPDC056327]|uniref:hypothetical protein n=1 Tax=Kitasatospora sp. NPDC056327 TaxID=3345785 RepID=UPI0035D9FFBA